MKEKVAGEIMDAANLVLDKIKGREVNKGRPVIRHGEEVQIRAMASQKEIISQIAKNIEDFRSLSYKSAASPLQKEAANKKSNIHHKMPIQTTLGHQDRASKWMSPSFHSTCHDHKAYIQFDERHSRTCLSRTKSAYHITRFRDVRSRYALA
jgi:hypothetical protein